jgi:hypothetical protein
MTTPTAQTLGTQAESPEAERDRKAACERAAALVCQCHDLDPLDEPFAHLAPGYPVEAAS